MHVLELTYGAVLVSIIAEFGFDNTTSGVLANVFALAFGLSALPVGILADRMDARKLLILCCFGTAIAAFFVGIAPNIILLGAAMLFLGLSLGIYHPTGTSYVSRNVSRRSLGFGYQGIGGNLGIALGPVMAGAIAVWLGWRWSYFIFAVPSLIIGGLIYLSRRNSSSATPGVETTLRSGGNKTPEKKESLRPLILPIFLLFAAQVMLSFVYRAMVTFLPKYLGEQLTPMFSGLNTQQIAAYSTTFVFIFGVIGQYLGGFLSERFRHEMLGIVVTLAAIPFMVATAVFTSAPLIVSAAVFAFFHFAGQPIYNTLVADYSPPSRRGLIFGLYFFFNFGLGSFSATMMGVLADRMGLSWVFLASAICAVVSSVFIAVLYLMTLWKSDRASAVTIPGQ